MTDKIGLFPAPPRTETEVAARLREVEGAMGSDVLSRQEFPHTGARRQRNEARLQAWVALDRERDWLRLILGFFASGHTPVSPYPAARREGLVAEAIRAPRAPRRAS